MREAAMSAVAHKDIASLRSSNLRCAETLIRLMEASGEAEQALKRLLSVTLPPEVRARMERMKTLTALLKPLKHQGVAITLDPLESRGFGYHSEVSFSFFAHGSAQELGRGGDYRIGEEAEGEPATGFTLYLDSLLDLLPQRSPKPRVYIAEDWDAPEARRLRAEGYITLHALTPGDAEREAARLNCTHVWTDGKLQNVNG